MEERGYRRQHTLVSTVQSVTRIGNLQHVLRPHQVVPIQAHRICHPIAIVCAVDHEFWQSQLLAIRIRIHHASQLSIARGLVAFLDQPFARVIDDLLAVLAPRIQLMLHLRAKVKHVNHHRSRGDHALIGHGRQPTRPASFRSAGDDKTFDRRLPFRRGQLFDGVHRLDSTFHHREEQRPRLVTGFEISQPCVRNQVVFFTASEKRLIRYLMYSCDASPAQLCQYQPALNVSRARPTTVASARDE